MSSLSSSREKPKKLGYQHANFFSRLTFSFVNPLIKLGSEGRIEEGTAREFLPDSDTAEILSENFEKAFAKVLLDEQEKQHDTKAKSLFSLCWARKRRTTSSSFRLETVGSNGPGGNNLDTQDVEKFDNIDNEQTCISTKQTQLAEKEVALLASSKHSSKLLWQTLYKLYARRALAHLLFCLMEVGARICTPVILRQLLDSLMEAEEKGGSGIWKGYMWAGLLSACGYWYLFAHHRVFFIGMRNGFLMRIQTIAAVYGKALRLNASSLRGISSGHVINLVSNDVNRFDAAATFWVFLICGPVELLAVFILVGLRLNFASAAVGILPLLIFIPIQAALAKRISKLRIRTAKSTDERVRRTSEGIEGILAFKMLAWEDPLVNNLRKLRQIELETLTQTSFIKAINMSLTWCVGPVSSLCCFATARYTGAVLTVANIFYAIALLNLLRLSMGEFFSHAVEAVSELRISIERLGNFLMLKEPPPPPSSRKNASSDRELEQPRLNSRQKHENYSANFTEGSIIDQTFDVIIGDNDYDWDLNDAMNRNNKDNTFGERRAKLRGDQPLQGAVSIDMKNRNLDPIYDCICPIDLKKKTPSLSSITLKVFHGELLAIIGPVGSGKSSIIAALLGELQPCRGSQIQIRGSVAHVGQSPWIMSDTVKNNILFGHKFEEDFYFRVLKACCLLDDIESMSDRDSTEIGERGISLSGGQKARLALARAAYSQSRVQLLDDPLSAVDPKVANHIFNECISARGIMGSSTRILITHQQQFLRHCDRIIAIKDGRIVAQGSYSELKALQIPGVIFDRDAKNDMEESCDSMGKCNESQADSAATELLDPKVDFCTKANDGRQLANTPKIQEDASHPESKKLSERMNISLNGIGELSIGRIKSKRLRRFISSKLFTGQVATGSEISQNPSCPASSSLSQQSFSGNSGKMIVKEEKEHGSVRWKTYFEMFKLFGVFKIVLVAFGLFGGQALVLYSEYWLAKWAATDESNKLKSKWVWGYGAMVGGIIIVLLSRSLIFFYSAIHAATSLHDTSITRLFRAPLWFYHTNPSGRILNRFSKDQGIIDEQLPVVAFDALQAMMAVFGALVLLSIVIPYILILFIPLGAAFVWIQQRYLKTSRELKRFEAISRSPIYASFSETLRGLTTIRTFCVSKIFLGRFLACVTENAAWWFSWLTCARWVGFRLDFLVSILLTVAPFLVVALRNNVSLELSGLALTQALYLAGLLQWTTRQTAEFEVNMTSVERVLRYCNLPQEPKTLAMGGRKPPRNWPSEGKVDYQNVTVIYRDGLPPVLKNVSFTLSGGSSYGIVGRTGSGKSSLMLSLFRLIPVVSGHILIDGINTATIGIDALRKQMAIIPQEPVLFSGSLRSNLSPWGKHTDGEIWEALTSAQLSNYVRKMGGLDVPVVEDGSNFSIGQRQLLCLARALLEDARILAADEATANVDDGTAKVIHFALNENSKRNRTLIIIAHRMHTITDCDELLVLSDGKIVETGIPKDLANVEGGYFNAMLRAAKERSKDSFI